MKQFFNTLYVSHPESYLAKHHETVVVKQNGDAKLQVPLHHLIGIVCLGPTIIVSPELMLACCKAKIGISYLNDYGRFLGRIEGAQSGNVLLRRAQFRLADCPEATLALSRGFVRGKVYNQRSLIERIAREHDDEDAVIQLKAVSIRLRNCLKHITSCSSMDILRGLEGEASAAYFSVIQFGVKNSDFHFKGRLRRPPPDPVNAMLSYLYSILGHDCASALSAIGLDAQVGYLHVDRPGRPSLALDLMEEFRSVFVDRLVLKMINLKQVRAKDFAKDTAGACRMKDETRKLVIGEYQKMKKEEITHPLLGQKVVYALLPHLQARLLESVN